MNVFFLELKLSLVRNHAAAVVADKALELAFEALELVAVESLLASILVLGDENDEAAWVFAIDRFPYFSELETDAIDLRNKFAGHKTIISFLHLVGNIIDEQ